MSTSPDALNSRPILGNPNLQDETHHPLSPIVDSSNPQTNSTSGLSSIEKDTVNNWNQKSAIDLDPLLLPVTKIYTPASIFSPKESILLKKDATLQNPILAGLGTIHYQALGAEISLYFPVDPVFAATYKSTPVSTLGQATSKKISYAGGTRQDFEKGIIFGTTKGNIAVNIAISGDIGQYYLTNVKSYSELGLPTGVTGPIVGGKQRQDFQKGMIVKSSSGTFAVKGAIWTNYLSQGGQNGVLGVPTGKEISRGTGIIQQNFSSGQILTTPSGTFTIKGDLGKYYKNLLATDLKALGLPTTNVFSVDGGNSRQFFQYGSIEWNGGSKVGAVKIAQYQIGFDGKKVNLAIVNEFNKTGGWNALGNSQDNTHQVGAGIVQSFQGGREQTAYITLADGSKTAFLVGGKIAARYDRSDPILPDQASPLAVNKPLDRAMQNFGYATADRYQFAGGTRQDFKQGIIFDGSKGTFGVTGNLATEYLKLANNATVLGLATGESIDLAGGQRQDFEKGSIFALEAGTFTVTGAIGTEYLAQADVLGAPKGAATPTVDGKSRQDFEYGSIFTSPLGTFTVAGDLAEAYLTQAKVLGEPTGNAIELTNGQRQDFEYGSMFVLVNGAFIVTGAIQTEYLLQLSVLGAPTSDATTIVDGKSQQTFENGSIFTSSVGTFTVVGNTADAYQLQASVLGSPTGNAIELANGTRQDFEHGSIFASETTTFSVVGAINTEYLLQAAELGLPTGNATTPVEGKSHQTFENGSIFTSPKGNFTLTGDIATAYSSKANTLGLPTGNAIDVADGKRQDFEHGSIFDLATGSFVATGAIGTEYLAQAKVLGNPIGNAATSVDGKSRQDFQNGSILSSSVGTFTVAGSIGAAYLSQISTLGSPKGEAVNLSGGEKQDFEQGSIFRLNNGTFTLQGQLNTVYKGLSVADRDRLGMPTAEQTNAGGYLHQAFQNGELLTVPGNLVKWTNDLDITQKIEQIGGQIILGKLTGDLRTVNGVKVQDFEKGSIFVTSTGAFAVFGAISTAYRPQAAGLGFPTGDAVDFAGGKRQDFQIGSIFTSAAGTYTVTGNISTAYLPQASVLGLPTGNAVDIAGGKRQDFQTGNIFTSTAGTYTVTGNISTAYLPQASVLGLPTGNATTPVNGISRQDFQAGSIFTSPAGTFTVAGVILTAYTSQASVLGSPKGNAVDIVGGKRQDFQTGSIFTLADKTFTVAGVISTAYASQISILGLPTGNATALGNGISRQDFQTGSIFITPTGTFAIAGEISTTYATQASVLGAPIGNATAFVNGISRQDFQTGSIFITPTGTFAIAGGTISTAYALRASVLGAPIGNATAFVNGISRQDFQTGSIFITPTTFFTVTGAISTTYNPQASLLGSPKGNTVDVAGGKRQDFQNGSIFTFPVGIITPTSPAVTFTVVGAISTAYSPQASGLGVPMGNAVTLANGTSRQDFQTGSIFTSPAGTFTVLGAIETAYLPQASTLGTPKGDVVKLSGGNERQDFETGSIFRLSNGTFTIKGVLNTAYKGLAAVDRDRLGLPKGNETIDPSGSHQLFENGELQSVLGQPAVKWPVNISITDKVTQLGGLGNTIGAIYNLNGVSAQDFDKGSIFVTSTGTFAVLGAIDTVYLQTVSFIPFPGVPFTRSSSLGLPTGDAVGVAGGSRQDFQNGSIFTSSAGTFTVTGTIGANYFPQAGGLGLPIGNVAPVNGGSRQDFQTGSIFITPTGTFTVADAIATTYTPQASLLGSPKGNAVDIVGGKRQDFQNGSIFTFYRTGLLNPARTLTVAGAISTAYLPQASGLGLPTGNATPFGGGSRQDFQNGSIFSSPTGTFTVTGAISTVYNPQSSTLGIPIGNATTPVNGKSSQEFQNGSIFTSLTGTFTVAGEISTSYRPQASVLGLPKGNVVDITGGKRQDFQNGSIFTSPAGTFTMNGSIDNFFAIGSFYQRNAATLGLPTSKEMTTNYGSRQDFQGALVLGTAFGSHSIHGSLRTYYDGLTEDQKASLGGAATEEAVGGDGNLQQFFAGGTIQWKSNGTGAINFNRYTIGFAENTSAFLNPNPAFTNKFNEVVGWDSLGQATGYIHPVTDGIAQDFEKGSIIQSAVGTFAVRGSIGSFYRQNTATLGLPTSEEVATSYGWSQNFQGAVVMHSPQFGTHTLHGSVVGYYSTLTDAQKTQLGAATTEEAVGGDGNWQQFFKGGSIQWKSNGTGAINLSPFTIGGDGNRVNPAFTTKFNQVVGWESLGKASGNVHLVNGGMAQDFEKGSIFQTAAGIFSVRGSIGSFYRQNIATLGLPTSEEVATSYGWSQNFQGAVVMHSPQFGTHTLHGSVGGYYSTLTDAQKTQLGAATTEEAVGGDGNWQQFFKGGTVLWKSNGTGEVKVTPFTIGGDGTTVNPAFTTKFNQVTGWDYLGAPTSNVTNLNGVLSQSFQKGTITQTGLIIEAKLLSNPDIDIQLTFVDNNFTDRQKVAIQKAEKVWESVIDNDKATSGIFKLAIAFSQTDVSGQVWGSNVLANAFMDKSKDSRWNMNTRFEGIGGIDFDSAVAFNINQTWDDELTFRVALHEIGHTLGLDHDDRNSGNILFPSTGISYSPYISDNSYQSLSDMGYKFNRNWKYV